MFEANKNALIKTKIDWYKQKLVDTIASLFDKRQEIIYLFITIIKVNN